MNDIQFMARAIELARKGYTSPNPMVGAVIVRGNEIIGEGYHKEAGGPHAEVNALTGIDARGATLYVSLEPCSHYGKTPPCTKTIINAGIKRVVCGMRDPNPEVHGIEELREAGIEVDVGVLEKECTDLNESFIAYIKNGKPFVLLKTAMSLDGKISSNTGDSKWITSDLSRQYVRDLRGRFDSILVGINTVLADDPSLRSTKGKDPLRIVLDSKLRIPLDAKVFDDTNVLIVTTKSHNLGRRRQLEKRGIEVLECGEERVDMVRLVEELNKRGVTSIFIEGGSEVNASALSAGIIDKFLFFIAPKLITGSKAKGPIGGAGIASMEKAVDLTNISVSRIGVDILVEAYPKNSN